MITIQSKIHVERFSSKEIFNFLTNPTDHAYQKWWPGTHLEFHSIRCNPNHIEDVVYMDEWIGQYRLKMSAVVLEADPNKRIVWQMQKGIRLPAWVVLELVDDASGVHLVHSLSIGFKGLGQSLDPLLRLYFSDEFAKAMDEHANTEFPMLREMLAAEKQVG